MNAFQTRINFQSLNIITIMSYLYFSPFSSSKTYFFLNAFKIFLKKYDIVLNYHIN